jgi:hypothetical protein
MVTVQLNDHVAAALQAKAAAQGLTLQAYLEGIALAETSDSTPSLSFDEFERLLDAESGGGTSPTGTFPRSESHNDHD